MTRKLFDVAKHPPNQLFRRFRIVQRDVVGDGIQIGKRRLGPDYFSHRAKRFLAWA